MAEPNPTSQPNSPGNAPDPGASPQAPLAVASPSTQQTPTANEPQRPQGLPDDFWDPKAGVKTDALIKSFGELSALKADLDAKTALVPATADAYALELPKDYKLPEGWVLDAESPAFKAGREFAKANGLSQEQFSGLARVYVDAQVAERTANEKLITEATTARDKALGTNGPARVEALNRWFTSAFGDQVGKQLGNTLFTPDIVGAFEKLMTATVSQGLTSFVQTGRTGGRSDGKPENWDQMSPVDRRAYYHQQNLDAAKGR